MRKNKEIAKLLNEIAAILELQNVEFKPRAYRRAALTIEGLGEDIADVEKLEDLPGVGKSIAQKIREYLKTGKIKYLEKLKKKTPVKMEELGGIEGLGPKTIKTLYTKLKVKSRKDLEAAAKRGKIAKLKGFSKKTEEKILGGITFKKAHKGRMLIGQAYPIAEQIVEHLKGKAVSNIAIAGSLRRFKETIGDVDILVTSKQPAKVMEAFMNMPGKKRKLAKGPKKASIIIDGLQVDLRIVDPSSWGAALQYFTGNKQHSIITRKIAIKKGYKLNEYGLFKSDKAIAAKTEEQIYKKLGLQYIPPELRIGKDEIELAQKKAIPKLVELKDIKGDFHVHSKYSDGANSILEMAKAAKQQKRKYMLQSDHTGTLKIAHAMSTKTIDKYLKEIQAANRKVSGFRILKGAEVNIMKDGNPDLPDKVLKKFDLCVGSIHSGFGGNATKRICKAMENPYINIIGHPTGRLLLQRSGYHIDINKICEKAKETNTALEINAQPNRLDLNGAMLRVAKDHKVKLAISTDSHNTDNLQYMLYGVGQARRGMLQKRDVLNTLSADKVLRHFR